MKLTRSLCYMDIESATAKGRPDAAADRIICLAICKVRPDGSRDEAVWLFNPGIPITTENAAIHGYTNEKVVAYKKLTAGYAVEIRDFIMGCDLAGFNCLNYDVPLLWEECYRAGVALNLDGVHIVDAGNIFKKKEERTLTAALKFYCGADHAGAHGAEADVAATIQVLEAQVRGEKWWELPATAELNSNLCSFSDPKYADLTKMDAPTLADFCKMDDRVDLFGTIVRNASGEAVFNTKRNQGVRVVDDVGYANWFLRNDFPANTKLTIEKILNQQDELFTTKPPTP